MVRFFLFLALTVCAAALALDVARTEQRQTRPYPVVAIIPPAVSADDSLDAFRARLAAVARSRIYADLVPLVQPEGFFWGRDFAHGYDPRKPAVDNLAAALALESRNGSGWKLLQALVAEPAVEPLPSRSDVVCGPARPGYDSVAFARLVDTTFTEAGDWAFPRAAETPVRAAPRADSAAIGTLGLIFVQFLGFDGPGGEPAPERTQWARINAPDGQRGFVPPGSLGSLGSEQLCYIKDPIVGWRIAGYIAGESRR